MLTLFKNVNQQNEKEYEILKKNKRKMLNMSVTQMQLSENNTYCHRQKARVSVRNLFCAKIPGSRQRKALWELKCGAQSLN